jgi:hypothetical protein
MKKYKLPKLLHASQAILQDVESPLVDLSPDPPVVVPDPEVLSRAFSSLTLFWSAGEYDEFSQCANEFCNYLAEFESVSLAHLVESTGFLTFCSDAILAAPHTNSATASLLNCIYAVIMSDPNAKAQFRHDREIAFRIINALDETGSPLAFSASRVLSEILTSFDPFTELFRIAFDRHIDSADFYISMASIFASLSQFSNPRTDATLIDVYRELFELGIWVFTLDGALALAETPSEERRLSILVQMTIPRQTDIDKLTLFDLLARELPNLDHPCLCVGLHLASICLTLCSRYPSLPDRIDIAFLGHLLEVDDEELSHWAVDVLLEVIKSPDYAPRIATPEFLVPLLASLENRPFGARHAAALTISQAVTRLPPEDIAELVERHFIDFLFQLLDVEDVEIAQQMLQALFRLAGQSEQACEAIAAMWDELAPLSDCPDPAVQSYLFLLDNKVHFVDGGEPG